MEDATASNARRRPVCRDAGHRPLSPSSRRSRVVVDASTLADMFVSATPRWRRPVDLRDTVAARGTLRAPAVPLRGHRQASSATRAAGVVRDVRVRPVDGRRAQERRAERVARERPRTPKVTRTRPSSASGSNAFSSTLQRSSANSRLLCRGPQSAAEARCRNHRPAAPSRCLTVMNYTAGAGPVARGLPPRRGRSTGYLRRSAAAGRACTGTSTHPPSLRAFP